MSRRVLIPILVASALAGCGGGSAPLPSADSARRSLGAALDAWKAGRPASTLASEKPGIVAVDFEWKAGKALDDFALGPEAPGQGVQTLAATLTLRGEPKSKQVTYMIMGTDPVRIFRDEDYDRAMNMDNSPAPARKPRR